MSATASSSHISDLEATGEENKEEFLRILYKAVGKLPVEMKIPNTLKAEQKLVQGRIEVMPYKDKTPSVSRSKLFNATLLSVVAIKA